MQNLKGEKLTLSKLGDINGGVAGGVFQTQLDKVLLDCKSRPALEDARKIPMVLVVTPILNPTDNSCLGFNVGLEIAEAKIPATKLVAETMRLEITHDADGVVSGIGAIPNQNPYQDRLDLDSPRKGAN
jgi:hypothetical protein